MEHIDWLPDELQGTTDPDDVISFLNSFPGRTLHPMQKKYGLMEWARSRGVEITAEHLEKIGIVRGQA